MYALISDKKVVNVRCPRPIHSELRCHRSMLYQGGGLFEMIDSESCRFLISVCFGAGKEREISLI